MSFLKKLFGFEKCEVPSTTASKNTSSDQFDDAIFSHFDRQGAKPYYEKGWRYYVSDGGRVFESAARNSSAFSNTSTPSSSSATGSTIHSRPASTYGNVIPVAGTAAAISIFQRQQMLQDMQHMNQQLDQLNDNVGGFSGGSDCGIDF